MEPTKQDDRPGEEPRRHTSPEDLRRGHDATYRLLHQHREPFREFLVEHCARWIDMGALDLDRMERIPESHVSDAGRRRRGDLARRVGYSGGDRHLVVVTEFQSTPDREMARRMHEYGTLTAAGLERSGGLDGNGLQPYGLAVVVYTGPEPWNPRGSLGAAGLRPDAQARLSRWSPFLFVDIRRLGRQQSGRGTLLGWLGRAEDDVRGRGDAGAPKTGAGTVSGT